MRSVGLVIKHEITKTIGRPSFWIMAFVFPLIIFAFTFGSQILAQGMMDDNGNGGDFFGGAPAAPKPVGYVDEAGIVAALPPGIPADSLLAYPSWEEAEVALAAGTIDQYYVVPADFVETSDVILIQDRFSPFQGLEGPASFEYILVYNLVDDVDVAALIRSPLQDVQEESVRPAGETPGEERPVTGQPSLAPMAMTFIFFFVLTMGSGFMLRSVTSEKENQIVEVLLLSISPRALMMGKMIGLGFVALLQMALWLGGVLLVAGEGAPMMGLAGQVFATALQPPFLLWAILYFILGYLTYASLLGALGTMAPNMREGSQFTFLVLLPLMIPLWLNTTFIEAPNGTLATVLSIFPLTSPVSMIARLAGVTVPLWQILVSLGLLAATTYGFVLLSARFFRPDTLLSSDALNMKRIGRELFGRKA